MNEINTNQNDFINFKSKFEDALASRGETNASLSIKLERALRHIDATRGHKITKLKSIESTISMIKNKPDRLAPENYVLAAQKGQQSLLCLEELMLEKNKLIKNNCSKKYTLAEMLRKQYEDSYSKLGCVNALEFREIFGETKDREKILTTLTFSDGGNKYSVSITKLKGD